MRKKKMNKLVLIGHAALWVLFLAAFAQGATWVVKPDGTGDFATIQEAIDFAAGGDVILLADGVFTGTGNRDIDFKGKALTLRSASGHRDFCIVDAEGILGVPLRCFDFQSAEGNDSVVRDITIRGGSTDDC